MAQRRGRTEAQGLRDLGVRYEPATAPAAITEAQAIATARTFPVMGASLAGATRGAARYVLFSDDQFAAKDAQGMRHPRYQRVLAWVVTFRTPGHVRMMRRTGKPRAHSGVNIVIDVTTRRHMRLFAYR